MEAAALDAVAFSHIIIDDLRLADGREHRGLLGGAGTYAVAGMRLVSDNVGIRCGVGADFADSHERWFTANEIDISGLEIRGAQTPRSWVVYRREDERTEQPQFGMEHFAKMAPRVLDLPPSLRQARGWYIFRDDEEKFWREAFASRDPSRTSLLWELHEGAAQASHWPAVARILKQVELVSLNRAEGRHLCGVAEPTAILERLLATGVGAVALRLGAEGALVASSREGWLIPAYPTQLQDPTGAGNAFSGAWLAGRAGGAEPLAAACGAAAAASFMIEQFGPPRNLLNKRSAWQQRRDWLQERAIVLH
ncbi:MAG: PfkB family carbohydrate kinase [Chloroflexi bacterium]|nr:PfkB family carbohydrate kinase [Chloroflexota bacterium]